MKLSSEQITANYQLNLKIIDAYITEDDRKKKIHEMIDDIGENYLLSPASSKSMYHGAYPGGYLVHINTVVKLALKEFNLYREMGGTVDFTEEELVFAALFHDLGKLGDGEKENYKPQDNEWMRTNKQEMYINNPDLDFMLIPDRSLFILQKYRIKVSQQEYLAIKLHDGLFEESNKAYYISYQPSSRLRSNITPILHTADFLASRIEFDIEHQKNNMI